MPYVTLKQKGAGGRGPPAHRLRPRRRRREEVPVSLCGPREYGPPEMDDPNRSEPGADSAATSKDALRRGNSYRPRRRNAFAILLSSVDSCANARGIRGWMDGPRDLVARNVIQNCPSEVSVIRRDSARSAPRAGGDPQNVCCRKTRPPFGA